MPASTVLEFTTMLLAGQDGDSDRVIFQLRVCHDVLLLLRLWYVLFEPEATECVHRLINVIHHLRGGVYRSHRL